MKRLICLAALAALTAITPTRGEEPSDKPKTDRRVYGEWRIHVKPDKGSDYDRLIAEKGLPLFRRAGGRMVGWWKTLIGDLYEHVTIWEYDHMSAFERAIGILGPDQDFAEFVSLRDPLLSGEDSRFLSLAAGARPPELADQARFVIHEIHRVPLAKQADYLKYMAEQGLPLLEKQGFRPCGPLLAEVGRWTEVTYLFRFESLAERQRLKAEFMAHADSGRYEREVGSFVEEVTTRLLLPAPFAIGKPPAASEEQSSRLLPHLQQLGGGVFVAGFADRHQSANSGWVRRGDHTLLVDLPRGLNVGEFLSGVVRTTGLPPRRLVLLRVEPGDAETVSQFIAHGVQEVFTTPAIAQFLAAESAGLANAPLRIATGPLAIGKRSEGFTLYPLDGVVGRPAKGAGALHLAGAGVLFAGPLVVNGPRASLPGSNTEAWVENLERLTELPAQYVVPGFGSWGSADIISRLRSLLVELRRQVGYVVAQGRDRARLMKEVSIPSDLLVWAPYDTPTAEDLEHVHGELTVPAAPFGGCTPQADSTPHALVLYADQPHEPGYIRQGLEPVFESTGVIPHFTVDVRSLSAENLAPVQLLVILRDGLQRPSDSADQSYVWMTPAQERAVVEFVERGGAFLNLHNSMGLYPADGPYLKLVGGRYMGHGPLERFRVEVVDRAHPITQGVGDFSVADERHTPSYDGAKVHLLLQNRSDGGQVAAAGWAYEPGRGRLCHLANGHTRESLLHPTYQLLLRNAILWCLRKT